MTVLHTDMNFFSAQGLWVHCCRNRDKLTVTDNVREEIQWQLSSARANNVSCVICKPTPWATACHLLNLNVFKETENGEEP